MTTTNASNDVRIQQIEDSVLLFDTISKSIESNTLVLFDVDHVLIMPTNEFSLSRNPYRKQLWKELKQRLPEDRYEYLHSIAVLAKEWMLVDPIITTILHHLKTKEIAALALTSYKTGTHGIIKKMEDLRIQQLNSLGIDFSNSYFSENEIYIMIQNDDTFLRNCRPLYKAGIILTADVDKGLVLECFLRSQQYFPNKILFIDDKIKNLESVEAICRNHKIIFEGIHYIAASKQVESLTMSKTHAGVSNDAIHMYKEKNGVESPFVIEKLRIEILEREHQWLSCAKVRQRFTATIEK